MAESGHPPARTWVDTALALAALRPSADTRVERLFQEVARQADLERADDLLDRVAVALGWSPPERCARIARAWHVAGEALRAGRAADLTPVPWGVGAYPDLLRQLPDPPLLLWVRGDVTALSQPAIAVVGSRAATPASLTVARALGRDLANAGLVVVSGMARGVDAAAHEGALEAGGRTVAVLGCGADRVYPSEHRALARRIAASGAVVSELPPGMLPLPHHFPLRNRIISGLSVAVVVVEASMHSGSLITARAALEQGRDVLAVPGGVTSGRHQGCHALIKDGARLVETVEDILEEVGWQRAPAVPHALPSKSLQISELEGTMAVGEPYSVDELAARTRRTTPGLLTELSALELAGRIARLPGGSYVRLD
ncbi:MAG TPA: DNA-processing protein DprA [Vicinamibacterales bacterium]|nr:DNA-processing protein DprA [Vicinamibacterales bacterium]